MSGVAWRRRGWATYVPLALGALATAFLASDARSWAAEAPAEETLVRLLAAHDEHEFSGVQRVVDLSGDVPRVYHQRVLRRSGDKERLTLIDEQGRPVRTSLREGTMRWTYLPEKNVVICRETPERSQRKDDPEGLSQSILRTYSVESQGVFEVMGRRAEKIRVRAPSGDRPWREIWVDVETGIPLRSDVYSDDDRLLRVIAFSELQVDPPVNPQEMMLRVPVNTKLLKRTERPFFPAPQRLGQAGPPAATVDIGEYVSGFRHTGTFVLPGLRGELRMVYSDGVAVLSLVRSKGVMPEIPLQVKPRRQVQERQFGSLRTVEWQNRGYRFSLVGELPSGIMRSIASTVP